MSHVKKTITLFLGLILFVRPLASDELTTDPPGIWESSCPPCAPLAPLAPTDCPPCFDESLSDKITVDLLNPIYENGVISTNEGGILIGPDVRIQAKTIVYTRQPKQNPPCFTVYCEGDLLIDYKDQMLVGSSFSYDFITRTGTLKGGKLAAFPWFLRGEELQLLPNGDIVICQGYVTSSEGGDKDVLIQAGEITVTRSQIMTARNVTLCVKKAPLFWLPLIKLDLKAGRESPLAFNFGWNGYLGTHAGVRYQFLSFGDFKGYARLDGYLGRGLGGGIETEYDPRNSCEEFFTRSYYAHDLSIDDPKKKDRYRFEGVYYNRYFDNTTSFDLLYDFVSDAQMAGDYQTHDFELNPAGSTELNFRRQEPFWIANLFSRVRVNHFQSVNQELPTFEMSIHPFEIFDTGIIFENYFDASYLHYIFSNEVTHSQGFHSSRFEVHPHLYRPFFAGPVTITPEAGFVGIAYGNSPSGRSVGQAVGDFGCHVETSLSKYLGNLKHVLIPYAHYQFLTNPRAHVDRTYIFTLNDAYAPLQLMTFGARNGFFSRNCFDTPLWIDIFANAFFDSRVIHQTIQKGYLNIDYTPHPRLFLELDTAYNFQEKRIDFYNTRAEWSISENLALKAEYRHRSRFDWRKSDFYDFLLDATRPQEALLASPLSDRRDVFLTRLFYRFNPDFLAKFELRYGWNRIRQPHYMEYLVGCEQRLFEHWRLLFTFEKRVSDTRCYVTFKLDPEAPKKQKWCGF